MNDKLKSFERESEEEDDERQSDRKVYFYLPQKEKKGILPPPPFPNNMGVVGQLALKPSINKKDPPPSFKP